MKFTKNSTYAKCILSVISKECNAYSWMSEDNKKAVDSEMGIILVIGNNNLTKNCLINYKIFAVGRVILMRS